MQGLEGLGSSWFIDQHISYLWWTGELHHRIMKLLCIRVMWWMEWWAWWAWWASFIFQMNPLQSLIQLSVQSSDFSELLGQDHNLQFITLVQEEAENPKQIVMWSLMYILAKYAMLFLDSHGYMICDTWQHLILTLIQDQALVQCQVWLALSGDHNLIHATRWSTTDWITFECTSQRLDSTHCGQRPHPTLRRLLHLRFTLWKKWTKKQEPKEPSCNEPR